MVVDKERDSYLETVVDPETKEIIHKCVEPLSQHRGHGSAKHLPSSEEQGEGA